MHNENPKLEAQNESPVETFPKTPAVAPAPLTASPVADTAYDPVRYFLKSNVFKAITVFLMIVYIFMALYLPVFTVSSEDSDAMTCLGINEVHFSLMDMVCDLDNEIKLCYTLDVDDAEDLKEYAEVERNAGKFTDAVTITVLCNYLKEESTDRHFFSDLFSRDAERGVVILAYLLLPVPLLFVIGLSFGTLVALISTVITFFKPTVRIKKLDAGACLITTIFFALCYVSHLMMPCFRLNLVIMGLLTVISIAAIVFHTIYQKHTARIIDDIPIL